jgi:DNA-binding Xre family transcriptional regulator
MSQHGIGVMSSPEVVVQVLRAQLRGARVTYKMLAERLDLSESSVKRLFGKKDMSLSRLALICKAAGLALEDILREAADLAPRPDMLTLAQERSLTADPRLLLVAICCLGHWSLAQIIETYNLTEAQCVGCLARLDKLGLIALRPGNGYRLRVSAAFHGRPGGPLQTFLREQVVPDFHAGAFDGSADAIVCLPARLSARSAREVVLKIRQLGAEIVRLQQQDLRQDPAERDGYTLMLGFRSWEFSGLTALRRRPSAAAQPRAASNSRM